MIAFRGEPCVLFIMIISNPRKIKLFSLLKKMSYGFKVLLIGESLTFWNYLLPFTLFAKNTCFLKFFPSQQEVFCVVKMHFENKGIKTSVHRNSLPHLKCSLLTEGLCEDICVLGDNDDNWPFLMSTEPDSPAIPPKICVQATEWPGLRLAGGRGGGGELGFIFILSCFEI